MSLPKPPLSPWMRLLTSIRTNGWSGFHRQILRMNDAKVGTLVGTDQMGNKYFENKDEHAGRDRWVDYGQYDFNGSQVPPEWHAWLNHIRADPPHKDPVMIASNPAWKSPHIENLTGTRAAFKTYSTTAPKYFAWEPKVAERH